QLLGEAWTGRVVHHELESRIYARGHEAHGRRTRLPTRRQIGQREARVQHSRQAIEVPQPPDQGVCVARAHAAHAEYVMDRLAGLRAAVGVAALLAPPM